MRKHKKSKKTAHRPSRKAPHQKRHGKAIRRRKKRFRSQEPGSCLVKEGVIVWTLPRKLQSLNKLRSWRARHGDTQAWEREIDCATIIANDMSLAAFSGQRLRLEITRLAPNDRWFLDRVNLYGGCKGLEDALVRLNFLVDDADRWVDMSAAQGVSDDGKYWTVIRLSVAKPEPGIVTVGT